MQAEKLLTVHMPHWLQAGAPLPAACPTLQALQVSSEPAPAPALKRPAGHCCSAVEARPQYVPGRQKPPQLALALPGLPR